MIATVKKPPIDLPVTVQEAREQCVIDHSMHDHMLEGFIRSIVSRLEPPYGWLGRPILNMTIEAHFERFSSVMRLPFPPLVSVEAIRYTDRDGAVQTVPTADYTVVTASEPGYVRIKSIPGGVAEGDDYPVVVEYVAGYGDDPEDVPPAIKHFILLSVAEAYNRREISEMGIVMTPNRFWLNMLESHRFRFFEEK